MRSVLNYVLDDGVEDLRSRGQALSGEEEIESSLDACLLTDEELTAGPSAWAALPDPLPA